jgi:hypothetical protein
MAIRWANSQWLISFCREAGFSAVRLTIKLRAAPVGMTGLRGGREKGNSKGQMRGSLHCAVHDKTMNSFGRDDDFFVAQFVVQKMMTKARATATATATAKADPLRG